MLAATRRSLLSSATIVVARPATSFVTPPTRRLYGLLSRDDAYEYRPKPWEKGGHIVSPPFQGRRRLAEAAAREAREAALEGRPPPGPTQEDTYEPPRRSSEAQSSRTYNQSYEQREPRSFDRAERRSSYDDERQPLSKYPYEEERRSSYDSRAYDRYEARSTKGTGDYRHIDPRAREGQPYERRPYREAHYEPRAVSGPDDLEHLRYSRRPLETALPFRQRRYADRAEDFVTSRGLVIRPPKAGKLSKHEKQEQWRYEPDYDPDGPPEKGSVKSTRKREDKLMADMLAVELPDHFPQAPPGGARFFATFKAVDWVVAHNAYKQFLRENGVRSARAASCGIKDTAIFWVKSPKELRLAFDRLHVPGVTVSLTPPTSDGRPTRKVEKATRFPNDFWIVKTPPAMDGKRPLKKLLREHIPFRVYPAGDGYRVRTQDEANRDVIFWKLHKTRGFEVTMVEPKIGEPVQLVVPPVVEDAIAGKVDKPAQEAERKEADSKEAGTAEQALHEAQAETSIETKEEAEGEVEQVGQMQEAEAEVPTETEESIVEPAEDDVSSDGEPTVPQPSESPEDVLPSGETKGTPPIS